MLRNGCQKRRVQTFFSFKNFSFKNSKSPVGFLHHGRLFDDKHHQEKPCSAQTPNGHAFLAMTERFRLWLDFTLYRVAFHVEGRSYPI